MNFIGTGTVRKSNESSVIVGNLPLYDHPQFDPLIFVSGYHGNIAIFNPA